MKKYRVVVVESQSYEVYVEADNEEEAEDKANELFGDGDESVEVTNQYIDYTEVEEES
jgi:hypothetical protein